jgi:hypothetical protein
MSRTIQKRNKFSKGEIKESLLERDDIDALYSSASFIQNLVSTPFGGLITRAGTKRIKKLDINSGGVTPTVNTNISNNTASLFDYDNIFISESIKNEQTLFTFDFGAVKNILSLHTKELGLAFSDDIKLQANVFNGQVTSIEPKTGYSYPMGYGLESVSIAFPEPENQLSAKASAEPILTEKGELVNTAITYPGFGYTKDTLDLTITTQKPSIELKLAISEDGINYEDIKNYIVSTSVSDFTTNFKKPFRFLKFYYAGGSNGLLKIKNLSFYNEQDIQFSMNEFIINEDKRYLTVMSDKQVEIFEDDESIKTVTNNDLSSTYLNNLKTSQKEDTMILCHPDLKTKQLQRFVNEQGVLDWEISDFPFKNVPFFLFGGEVETAKTSTLTPSAEEGGLYISSSANDFTADSVGQYIDGNGGRLKITQYENAKKVYGYTIIPFYTKDAFSKWTYITGYEKAWSETKGYPATASFYQQRLFFGGSRDATTTLWASKVDQYNNFENTGSYKNDSIDVTFSDTQNPIVDIYPNRGMQVFTEGSEHIIPEGALNPEDIYQVKSSTDGCLKTCNVTDINGTTLFIEKNGKNLLSFVYDETQSAYTPSSLSLLSDMIDEPVSMAVDYNSIRNDGNFLYIVNGDGTMATACILLDQKINSYVRFVTEGAVKKVCSVGSDIYIIVQREGAFYLEKLDRDVKTDNTIKTTVNNRQITGLSEFDNKQVYVYSFKEDYGIYTVNNGVLDLDIDINEDVYVGLPYDWELISNKIAINRKTGSVRKRIAEAVVETINTKEIKFCGYKSRNKDIHRFSAVTNYARDVRFSMQGSSINQAEILSVELRINYGDR